MKVKFREWDFGVPHIRDAGWSYWGYINDHWQGTIYGEPHPSQGQFTGLLDRKGIEIYEGDIVEFDCPEGLVKQQVIFNRGAFTTKSGRMWGFEEGTENLGFYEVIGNIYENKELLDETK